MEVKQLIALIVLSPVVTGLLMLMIPQNRSTLRAFLAFFLSIIPFLSCIALFSAETLPSVAQWDWIPPLDLSLSFRLDGLSLFFGLVVSFIGVLITIYTLGYFELTSTQLSRFLCTLFLFQSAMLATVFSNNLLLMFVFWELTGLTSFLLIGFKHEYTQARVGARMSLFVTMFTGLLLLVGIILLRELSGSFEFDQILAMDSTLFLTPKGNWALFFMLMGAFGKSAQFPFHFWLPNAMSAPTPVSAFLHSATMVKLGIFLIARLFPIFSDSPVWMPLLMSIGIFTSLTGIVLSLRSHDLKEILAYSTIAQLGFYVAYYGWSRQSGASFDTLHILTHVFYKASLFMIVGMVDCALGTRDIRKLGGLRKEFPLLAVLALIACGSAVAFPGTLSFISKEIFLADLFRHLPSQSTPTLLMLLYFSLFCILKVTVFSRLWFSVFSKGSTAPDLLDRSPLSFRLYISPVLLCAATVLTGTFPTLLTPFLVPLTQLGGLGNIESHQLTLWHGFSAPLFLSLSILVVGYWIYFRHRHQWNDSLVSHHWKFDYYFNYVFDSLSRFSKKITTLAGFDDPSRYLLIATGFTLVFVLPFVYSIPFEFDYEFTLSSFILFLVTLSAFSLPLFLKSWISKILSLSAGGLLITFYYVSFKAPDLALTQIFVETASLFLILILLRRMKLKSSNLTASLKTPHWDSKISLLLSIGMGVLIFFVTIIAYQYKYSEPIGPSLLEKSVPYAFGNNAVNTILIDFRGFDTLGEILVLLIALLGAIGLLQHFFPRKRDHFKEEPMKKKES